MSSLLPDFVEMPTVKIPFPPAIFRAYLRPVSPILKISAARSEIRPLAEWKVKLRFAQ